MSNFARFMKKNKKVKENGFYVATESLCDEKGEPLKWELKAVTSKENEDLRESCTIDVPITGKPGAYRPKLKMKEYTAKLICASVVTPDLYNAELQDSYGVATPEELVYAMVDAPGEYSDFANYIQRFQGFETLDKKVEEAKN